MSDRPLLYVAAPYTHPDPVMNTHFVCRVAMEIYERAGWVPVVPHLSLLWHAITPRPINVWYDIDNAILTRCDAIVRLPGQSTGADAELALAIESGLQVVGFDELPIEARELWVL